MECVRMQNTNCLFLWWQFSFVPLMMLNRARVFFSVCFHAVLLFSKDLQCTRATSSTLLCDLLDFWWMLLRCTALLFFLFIWLHSHTLPQCVTNHLSVHMAAFHSSFSLVVNDLPFFHSFSVNYLRHSFCLKSRWMTTLELLLCLTTKAWILNTARITFQWNFFWVDLLNKNYFG